MPGGRYPWAMRAGGPLLGGGGGPVIPTLFEWNAANDTSAGANLPVGAVFSNSAAFNRLNSAGTWTGSAANVLLLHTVPGGRQGYLSEPFSTNEQGQSQPDAGWSLSNLTAVDNGPSVVGFNTSLIDAGVDNASHFAFNSGGSAPTWKTVSVRIIKGTGRYFILRIANTSATDYAAFDLDTFTVTETGSNVEDAGFIDIANPNFITVYGIVPLGGGNTLISTSDTGTPGSGVYTYQAANETYEVSCVFSQTFGDLDFVTSPVETVGSPVDRQADRLKTGVIIPAEYGLLLDVTLPHRVGNGKTITLMGAGTSAVDIIRVDENYNIVVDDGGTPFIVATSLPNASVKISYGRDATSRSCSVDGNPVISSTAPGAAHEGEEFEIGTRVAVNHSRSVHHETNIYEVKPTDEELVQLSGP